MKFITAQSLEKIAQGAQDAIERIVMTHPAPRDRATEALVRKLWGIKMDAQQDLLAVGGK